MKLFLRFLAAIIFSVGLANVSFAQKSEKKAKQIETIKVGYISGHLNLNPEESRAFWPLYKEYQAEFNNVLKLKRQARIDNVNNPEKAVDDDFYFDGKLLELKKSYRKAFGKVLSPEKLKSLYQAERSFREELIKQLKSRSKSD